MVFDKQYKDLQAQSLVIRQKLAEARELSRDDINTVVNLTAFDFMDSSSLRSSVLIFGKMILHLSNGAIKNYQKKGEEKNGN
jgi:hypothetical protein